MLLQAFTVKLLCTMNVALYGVMVAFLQFYVQGRRHVSVSGGIGAAFAVFVAPLAIIVSTTISGGSSVYVPSQGHANTDVVESRQPEASDPDQERGVHALLALLLPHLKRRRLVLLRPPHEGLLRRGTHSMRMASFNKLIMIFLTFNHPFLVCYYIAFLTFLSTRFQS
jgi:hypothetical protein